MMVYSYYRTFYEIEISTALDLPLTLDEFVSVWHRSKDLHNIKTAKAKPCFSKCDPCKIFKRKLKKELTKQQRDAIEQELYQHIGQQKRERDQYAKNKD